LLGGGVTGGTVEADAVTAMWTKNIVKIDVLQSAEPHLSIIAGNKLSQRRRGKARRDRNSQELGEASKEAGEGPEVPPSRSKSANFFANEAGIVASSAKRM
jgi:hypothetical protein